MKHFLILSFIILSFSLNAQKFRQEIQDYNTVSNLRNENLTPRRNDKAYIQATKHLYAFDWNDESSTDDGLSVIVQNGYRWKCLNCGVKALNNYSELRSLSNYYHDLVVVNDWTYEGPDGNNYTTLGGVFKKVSSGSENGGTIIVGNYIWERDWDNIHVQPEWWECGGYDRLGQIYTNKNTNTEGIYNESDRLDNAAKFIIYNQGGAKISLIKKLYEVDRPIVFTSTDGNGAVIKHIRPNPTTNTAVYTSGQNTITVDNINGFRVGQYVCLTKSGTTNLGYGYGENIAGVGTNPDYSITNISGNVITISQAGGFSIPIGNSFAVAPMLGLVMPNSKINNVWFNGNGDLNTNTLDFRFTHFLGNAGNVPTLGGEHMTIFEGCRFDDIIGTAFVGANFKILSCAASNIGGGIFHYGGSGDTIEGLLHNCEVNGLQASNMGYVDPYVSYHQEALFTFSTNAKNISISNVNIIGLKNAVFGVASEGHHTFELSNSTFEGERPSWASIIKPHILGIFQVGFNTPFNDQDQQRVFRISNCTFNTCGDLLFKGQDILNSENISNIIINNNRFNNVRIGAMNTSNLTITNNKFTNITFGGHGNYTYPCPLFSVYTSTAQITANYCDRVDISNNYLEGQEVYSEFLDYGIQAQMKQVFRKNSSGTNTKIWYCSNIKINNNIVSRYSFGIGHHQRFDDALSTWNSSHQIWGNGMHLGNEINNNIILFHKDTQYDPTYRPIWGIFGLQGTTIADNKIYHPLNTPSNVVRSIILWGINDGEKANLFGGIIKNNTIWSLNGIINILAGTGSGGDGMEDNIIIQSNATCGSIYTTKGYQPNNYRLQANAFAHLTSPYMNPDLSGWMQNFNQY